jgi:uncharacterized protein (TIGR03083 family)
MDRVAEIEVVRVDSARLLEAHHEDPAAPVWEGLGWDRTELLSHVAFVQTWARTQLRAGTEERVRFSDIDSMPTGEALREHFTEGAEDLVQLLTDMDHTVDWPTWAGIQPGSFYSRRMAQEVTVHRWDAIGGPIDGELAADGVLEMLELFVPRLPAERFGSVTGSLHLHATDVEGEWLIHLGKEGITFELGHAKGDVALRGQAGDLVLWCWNRVPVDDRFEVFGDTALLDTWRSTVVI